MIKTVEMYTAICDRCGVDVNSGEDIAAWNDKGYVEEMVENAGWHEDGGKHYCTNCFITDEDDEITIKPTT